MAININVFNIFLSKFYDLSSTISLGTITTTFFVLPRRTTFASVACLNLFNISPTSLSSDFLLF